MVAWLNREWSKDELCQRIGHIDQIASIKLVHAADGYEQGARVLQVDTGSGLTFRVNADRALDISQCSYRGTSLVWRSPSGDVHPAYYEPQDIGWLRSFSGGLVVTCGLDQFGEPTTDQEDRLGLHGRISHTPANQLSYRSYWDNDEYILEISGQMRQQRLFGENLLLSRRIVTRLGSRRIYLEDAVTNEGFEPQPHMLLYHCNFGFPLICEDTRLTLDSNETIGCDERACTELDQWHCLQEPSNGYQERVYRHQPVANASGRIAVQLDNSAIGIGLQLSYDNEYLPYLYQWKVMAPGVYVLGLEPANCGVMQGRNEARNLGQLPVLEPAETRHYRLQFEVLETIN